MKDLAAWAQSDRKSVRLSGLSGSSFALVAASLFKTMPHHLLLVEDDSEQAAYLYNDLKYIFAPDEVFYFPSSYKRAIKLSQLDAANEILRTEVLNRLSSSGRPCIIVTSPEAVMQRVVSSAEIKRQMLPLRVGESVSIDFIAETLTAYGFQRVDFVYEPGQFSVRGGIVDIFSYSFEMPFRIDFFGDEVESIRIFDIETQLSQDKLNEVSIIPDLKRSKQSSFVSFFQFIDPGTWVSYSDYDFIAERIDALYQEALDKGKDTEEQIRLKQMDRVDFVQHTKSFRTLLPARSKYFDPAATIEWHTSPQAVFHKNFDLVADNLKDLLSRSYHIYICSDSVKQTDRIAAIFADRGDNITFQAVKNTLHEGFIDHDARMACYTDHQLFERFHKFQLRTDRSDNSGPLASRWIFRPLAFISLRNLWQSAWDSLFSGMRPRPGMAWT